MQANMVAIWFYVLRTLHPHRDDRVTEVILSPVTGTKLRKVDHVSVRSVQHVKNL